MKYLKMLENFIEKGANNGELSNIHKTEDDYDPIQETPKRNTKQVTVAIKYDKGNLRIEAPDIRRLFLEIKRELPKGSIVLHEEAIFVAFYFLPVLLKVLQQSFGSIDADSTIPDLEGVRRLLGMGEVNVEVALAAEMENPVTKLLLGQKPSEEVAEITQQLKAELQRSQWVDSIWGAVRKGLPLSEEVIKGEEFDGNTGSKVDDTFTENNNFSLNEPQALQKYKEKGGEQKMGFDIDIEDPIEGGVSELTIFKVDTKEGKFGPTLQVTFKHEDGRSLANFFPLPAKLSNKTGQLIKKALGEFRRISSDELIGKKVKVLVEHVQRDGRTYVNITKIL